MLRESKGNMYEFVTHTWNIIIGVCLFNCLYCFMKKLVGDKMKGLHFDEGELNTDLGSGNFIFVGSSTDAWSSDVPSEWITKMLDYCNQFDNRYLFQSKDPARFLDFIDHPVYKKAVFCTTIESNYHYTDISGAPPPSERAEAMEKLADFGFETYVTVEPVMEFEFYEMVDLILQCKPKQVNIGRNTNHDVELLEPIAQKVRTLAEVLRGYGIKVEIKKNIREYLTD